MRTEENQNDNSLLAGGEPHQIEELDQAEAASLAAGMDRPQQRPIPY